MAYERSADFLADPLSVYESSAIDPAERIAERRSVGLKLMDVYERDYRQNRKIEDFWRSVRAGTLLAPLLTAVILVGTGAKKLDRQDKELIEAVSVVGTLAGFGRAWHIGDKILMGARKTGVSGAELTEQLGIATRPWIEEALAIDPSIGQSIAPSISNPE